MRRRAGESFVIGDEIQVEVLEVSSTRVKLGIVAPESVVIVRKETQITENENVAAAKSVNPASITSLMQKFRR